MRSKQIEFLVEQGNLTELFFESADCCASESLWDKFLASGATVFANFAYTDYGALCGGIIDYAVIRYVKENYPSKEGSLIEAAGYGGENMILYGKALSWLRDKLSMEHDDLGELYYSLSDEIFQYESEGARMAAKDLIEHDVDFVGCDEDALAESIEQSNTGMNNTNTPDFYADEVMQRYRKIMSE